jgi:prepilin-type N-terminal cleavage/methylation domain-containing protein/prepilin-type processing-associated H-X9-DG protein
LKRGLTLIEMLVTIGIIGLLAGVLLPAVTRVNEIARGTRCKSQLRQMAIAAQTYATWTDDGWPVAVEYDNDGVHTTRAWDWVQTTAGELIGPGALWSFSDNPGEVMQCPSYTGDTNFADPFTGYAYNTSYLGAEETWTMTGDGDVRSGVAPHACSRSTTCAMFGCAGRRGGTHKFMRAPLNREGMDLPTLYSGGQAFRHTGATNVVHVDGHVGGYGTPKPGRLATEELLANYMDYPDNGFLSDDDHAYDPR